jgi:hypothetical protein
MHQTTMHHITEYDNLNTNCQTSGRLLSYGIHVLVCSGVPRNFIREGSTISVEDRGLREQGSGGGSPLVSGSTQFANE